MNIFLNKKCVCLWAILFFTTTISAQVINIDEKRGFKDFKIGDDYEKWKTELTELGDVSDTKGYVYNGACCKEILDYHVKSVYLFFDRTNKLVSIEVRFDMVDIDNDGAFLTGEVISVLNTFKSYFGAPQTESVIPGKFIYTWGGKSVIMALRIVGDYKSSEAIVIIRDFKKAKEDVQNKF